MKRIVAFVFLCAFVLTMTAAAWAAAQVTAKSDQGIIDYNTFKDAIDAIDVEVTDKKKSGDVTITLKQNIELSATQTISRKTANTLTIDLSNYNISSDKRVFEINSGDVIIKGNGIIRGTGTTPGVIRLGAGIANSDTTVGYANLTITKGVKITSKTTSGIVISGKGHKLKDNKYGQVLDFNGEIEINGNFNAIYNYLDDNDDNTDSTDIKIGADAVIKVNSGRKFAGIFHPGSGDLTISGGTIDAPTAIEMKRGTAKISGGTFTSSMSMADPDPTPRDKNGVITGNEEDDNTKLKKNTTSGYSLAAIQSNNLHSAPNITITGGQFKGYIAIIDTNGTTKATVESNLKVTGGKFSSNDVQYYVPSGTKVTKQGDWYVVGTASSSTPATKTVSADVSSSGALTYQVENGTATLSEVADKLDSAQKAKVTSIELDSKITAASNSDLKSFSNLKTLALKSDSAVSDIDLSGVSATTFNAKGATKLSKLTLKRSYRS